MKLVVATEHSTLILWLRASLLASPTEVPASTVPCRCTPPVRARIASNRVVLPLWNGPTSATHRGPLFLLPLGPVPFWAIDISLAGRGGRTRFPGPVVLSSQASAGLARAGSLRSARPLTSGVLSEVSRSH